MDAALPPPVQFVESDVPCSRCGYSLRGLLVTKKCPECGWPVEASLRGGLLRYAGPEYLSSLITGALVIVVTNIASLVVSVLALIAALVCLGVMGFGISGPAAGGGPAPPVPGMAALGWIESASTILAAVLTIASLVGYWQFTVPDPATSMSEQPRAARRVVRAAVMVSIAIQLVLVAAALLGPRALPTAPAGNPFAVSTAVQLISRLLNLAALFAGAVHFFAMMLYVRWLAQRIPDPDMVQQTRLYIWLLPLLYTVGTLCIGLGPIVGLVLYVIMLWKLRTHVVVAREQALTLAAA